MKYETRIIIFVIILCILCLLVLTKEYWFGYKEGARTLPRPTRHAYDKVNNTTLEFRVSAGQQSMNQWTDQLISQYFDENNVPYTNTVSFYSKFCVSQGFTTNENKMRLKDLCFYFINYVIPSLPSGTTPVPNIVLPPIEFNSTNFNAYDYNASGLANLSTNYWLNNPGPSFYGNLSGFGGFNNFNLFENTDASGISDISAGSPGISATTGIPGSSNSNNCGGTCPSSCLGSLVNSMNGTSGTGGLNGIGSYNASLIKQYDVSFINPYDVYNLTIQSISPYSYIGTGGYLITDLPNLYLNTNIQKSPLNNNIIGLFATYFDVSSSDIYQGSISADREYNPTPYAINTFDYFTKHYLPIDDDHKNKLRDLAFYIMEEIIPGLPTSPDHPNSYVEWKPIRWLSRYSV